MQPVREKVNTPTVYERAVNKPYSLAAAVALTALTCYSTYNVVTTPIKPDEIPYVILVDMMGAIILFNKVFNPEWEEIERYIGF